MDIELKKQKAREATKRYAEKHREKVLERGRIWRLKNIEHIKIKNKEYVSLNRDKVRKMKNDWAAKNREHVNLYSVNWQKNNPEKIKQKYLRYKITGKDIIKRNNLNRRARKLNANGKLPKSIINDLLIKQNYECVYCSVSLINIEKHVDHIIPICKGGSNEESNVQLTCKHCNCSKGKKNHEEYIMYLSKIR